jgi:lysophospholipase L1-like esterase
MLNDLTTWLNSFKAPKEDAIRVACIGNSITDGFGIDMADQKGYPAQLQKKLGEGYHVENFGVSSRTLLNKGDYPYMKEEAWHDALTFNPNVVIVKLGTNDSKPYVWKYKDEFLDNYKQMIDSLKALPSKPLIYICTPIPGQNEGWGITDKVITEEVIPMIQKVAKKNKVQLIDLHSLYTNVDGNQMQRDGVHPTEKGAAQLADLIYQQIKK